MSARIASILALGGLAVAALAPVQQASAAARCPVSSTAPVPGNAAFNVGTGQLGAALPKGATFRVVPEGRPGWAFLQRDGRIRVKLGWLSPSRTPICPAAYRSPGRWKAIARSRIGGPITST